MKRKEILETIRRLSMSQGSYGRLLRNLTTMEKEDPEAYEIVMNDFEKQNFKEPLDLILYIEE